MRISDWSSDVCSSDLIALQLMKRPSSDEEFLTVPILVDFASIRPGDQPVHRALRSAPVNSLTNSSTYATSANFNVSLANGQVFNVNEIGRGSCRARVCQYV